jgi:hypothetical protein
MFADSTDFHRLKSALICGQSWSNHNHQQIGKKGGKAVCLLRRILHSIMPPQAWIDGSGHSLGF